MEIINTTHTKGEDAETGGRSDGVWYMSTHERTSDTETITRPASHLSGEEDNKTTTTIPNKPSAMDAHVDHWGTTLMKHIVEQSGVPLSLRREYFRWHCTIADADGGGARSCMTKFGFRFNDPMVTELRLEPPTTTPPTNTGFVVVTLSATDGHRAIAVTLADKHEGTRWNLPDRDADFNIVEFFNRNVGAVQKNNFPRECSQLIDMLKDNLKAIAGRSRWDLPS